MMDARPIARHQQTAALLERAYRMALTLQGCVRADEMVDVPASAFDQFVIAAELVAILDEARVALLEQGRPEAESGV